MSGSSSSRTLPLEARSDLAPARRAGRIWREHQRNTSSGTRVLENVGQGTARIAHLNRHGVAVPYSGSLDHFLPDHSSRWARIIIESSLVLLIDGDYCAAVETR